MEKERPPGTTLGPGAIVPESTAAPPSSRLRLATSPIPESIGPYRILSQLGEGGMGTVFKAEQQNPHRLVALKVIKAGFVTGELVRRFAQEAEALGRLQHVGIAQVYEAGTADSGFGLQPYFAMEFIEGRPLLAYAADQHLDVRARLELMAKVCDAVNHAHQRGIIHRDLKPGNILVDAGGQPKVLDFGVARVTDSDTQATRQTDIGQLIGTLAYMSPEQALANPDDLDLRSDVYTLGVILYQLLADKLPYQAVQAAIHEVIRVIREEDPAPLSSINRSYRGDIETIVAKALEKDKARRYGTAADMASDIRRHLCDEPIAARPASASYQMQKFARRHKALVAGATAVFLALLIGVIASTIEATRARKAEHSALAAEGVATSERDRAVKAEQQATTAEHRAELDRNRAQDSESKALRDRNLAQEQTRRANTAAATSKAVSDFLQYDLLNQSGSGSQSERGYKPDPNLTVRTALDRAADSVAGKFGKQPEVEAEIENTIGASYMNLGLYSQTEKHFARAAELARKSMGDANPYTATFVNNYAVSLGAQGKIPQAEAFVSHTLDTMRQELGDSNPNTLRLAVQLGQLYMAQNKFPQAQAIFKSTLATQRRVLGAEHADTLASMSSLADAELNLHHFAEAEALRNQLIAIHRRTKGPEDPSTLQSMHDLAQTYFAERKYAESEAICNQLVEIKRRTKGPQDPSTLDSMAQLAQAYSAERKYAQAEELLIKVVDTSRGMLSPEDPILFGYTTQLSETYRVDGKYAQAEELLSQTVETMKHARGAEDPDTLSTMDVLAGIYSAERKYPRAEELLKQTMETRRRVLGDQNMDTIEGMNTLAGVYQAEGKNPEAEALLFQVLDLRRRALGPESIPTLQDSFQLALLYEAEGKFAEAEALLTPALQIARRVVGPGDRIVINITEYLASALSHLGRYDEAEKLFRDALRDGPPARQAILWYNFGCGAAVAGRKDDAFKLLGQAIDHGFNQADDMSQDDDLKSLHSDPRFDALVARARQAGAGK